MKISNALLGTSIAAASWNPSSARPDKLTSAEPTQSPQPLSYTLQSNGSEQDSIKNPPTGAPVRLDEVTTCDRYRSSEFTDKVESCDTEIESNWLGSKDYIDLDEYSNPDRIVNLKVAGGVFTIIFGCCTVLGALYDPAMLVGSAPFTLIGIGLLTAGFKQQSNEQSNAEKDFAELEKEYEKAFAEFEEEMRTKLLDCVEVDNILKGCVEISNETHGHLRG
jgi:hypothetical protein